MNKKGLYWPKLPRESVILLGLVWINLALLKWLFHPDVIVIVMQVIVGVAWIIQSKNAQPIQRISTRIAFWLFAIAVLIVINIWVR